MSPRSAIAPQHRTLESIVRHFTMTPIVDAERDIIVAQAIVTARRHAMSGRAASLKPAPAKGAPAAAGPTTTAPTTGTAPSAGSPSAAAAPAKRGRGRPFGAKGKSHKKKPTNGQSADQPTSAASPAADIAGPGPDHELPMQLASDGDVVDPAASI